MILYCTSEWFDLKHILAKIIFMFTWFDDKNLHFRDISIAMRLAVTVGNIVRYTIESALNP